MENRQRILDAAARVYAEVGFRGATTRRIAQEAGVNEVTIFRIFGSKADLLAEAVHCCGQHEPPATLPAVPTDPAAELEAWAAAHLRHLAGASAFIRKTLGEVDEHPELVTGASAGPTCAARELEEYLGRLRDRGLARPDLDARTATAFLMGALFSDAMGREFMPEMFPQPESDAPVRYTALFLRAIGAAVAPSDRPADDAHVAGRS